MSPPRHPQRKFLEQGWRLVWGALSSLTAQELKGDRIYTGCSLGRKKKGTHLIVRRIKIIRCVPFVVPGINVVSAADFGAEAGPIEHYANAKTITGRAGLRPSRYQSDAVDKANGPLVRACNRSLRAAILGIADNLIVCNHHFQVLATQWAAQGKDPRHTRVKVALRFCRIAFQMVAGRQVFRHPSIQGRHYILDKLTAFHREHDTGMAEVLRDLQAAVGQVPSREYAAEAKPLAEELRKIQEGRRRGPQLLGDILPIVLARLGVGAVQSVKSGE
jgi:transposase